MSYDIAIIGSGPGGYVATLRAARLGAKVALIEKGELGGICLNKGCIPTKALAASANALEMSKRLEEFGLREVEKVLHEADFKLIQQRKDKIVTTLRKGIEQLLKLAGVDIIKGEAKFDSPGKISVSGSPIDTKRILIATGSNWWFPSGIKINHKTIITGDDLLAMQEYPKSIIIVGGGVVGCEFASILNSFGVKVTIVEAMSNILPFVEETISRTLQRIFKSRGIGLFTENIVESTKEKGSQVSVKLSKGEELISDCVLVCVGRRPNLNSLNIENSGIKLTEKGAIKVNDSCETNMKGVFAIGDVVGGYMLAHVASAEGVSCVEQIFGEGKPLDYRAVPSPIFTLPEIASVGMNSQELKKNGISFKTGRFSYAASGKALCDGEKEGVAIVHVNEKGLILGAHFMGKEASLLVAEATLAIKNKLTAYDIGETIHSHPTLSEIFAEAALDAVGMAVHKIK